MTVNIKKINNGYIVKRLPSHKEENEEKPYLQWNEEKNTFFAKTKEEVGKVIEDLLKDGSYA